MPQSGVSPDGGPSPQPKAAAHAGHRARAGRVVAVLPGVSAVPPAIALPQVTLCPLILGDPDCCGCAGQGWSVAPGEPKPVGQLRHPPDTHGCYRRRLAAGWACAAARAAALGPIRRTSAPHSRCTTPCGHRPLWAPSLGTVLCGHRPCGHCPCGHRPWAPIPGCSRSVAARGAHAPRQFYRCLRCRELPRARGTWLEQQRLCPPAPGPREAPGV